MKKEKITKTDRVLVEMLKENTGRHFLDSGGAYGRNWEKNQARNFFDEPQATLEFVNGYPIVNLNIFHWLRSRLTYSAKYNNIFNRWANRKENKDNYRLKLMEEFPDFLKLKGCDINDWFICNSYNHQDILSQTIEFLYMQMPSKGTFVLLQIHGGCDIRGGYTNPRAFFVDHDCEDAIMDFCRATIFCNNSNLNQQVLNFVEPEKIHCWDTDDGCNFYFEGCSGNKLNDYEVIELKNGDKPILGKLSIDNEGKGYCPKCGSLLEAGIY